VSLKGGFSHPIIITKGESSQNDVLMTAGEGKGLIFLLLFAE